MGHAPLRARSVRGRVPLPPETLPRPQLARPPDPPSPAAPHPPSPRYKATNGDLRVPTRFCVPEEDGTGFPEKCRGLKLGQRVASIRATGRYVADEGRRQKLDALGFEWRLRRPSSASSAANEPLEPFEVLMEALESYKELHDGSVSMSANFVVPRVDPWPPACRGLPLGSRLQTIKESDVPYFDAATVGEETIAKRVAELARLGVMRRPAEPEAPAAAPKAAGAKSSTTRRFEIVYEALSAYKAEKGHVNVPQTFVVPPEAPWPEDAWEMKLGSRVNAIRSHGTFLKRHPERRQRLLDLGLQLNVEAEPERSGSILDAVLLSNGDAWGAVEEVEEEDAGKRVVPLSCDFLDETLVPAADLERCLRDGFAFDEFDGGYDFEDVVDALREYAARYGDFAVPLDFVVPELAEAAEGEGDAESEEAENLDAALAAFLSSSAKDAKGGEDAADADLVGDLDAPSAETLETVEALLLAAGDEPSLADLEALEAEERFGGLADVAPWPERCRGLGLGAVVEALRVGDVAAWDDPARRAALDDLGFHWGDRDVYVEGLQWDAFLACLFSHSKIKGTVNVDWDFVVPDEDPWPFPLRASPLGRWVNEVRDQQRTFDAHFGERKRFLDLMGFQWLPPVFEAGEPEYDDRLPPCLRLTLEELNPSTKRRRKAAAPKAKKQPLAMPVEGEVTDYTKYTVKLLKDFLRDRGLPVSGRRKADYVERLDADDARKAELKAAALAADKAAGGAPDADDDDDLDDDDDDDDDDVDLPSTSEAPDLL